MAADRFDVGALGGRSRHHQLAPGADRVSGDVRFLCLAHADGPLDLSLGDVKSAARAIVERHQHVPRRVARLITAAHGQAVAARGDIDVQPVLENSQILIMLAAEQR